MKKKTREKQREEKIINYMIIDLEKYHVVALTSYNANHNELESELESLLREYYKDRQYNENDENKYVERIISLENLLKNPKNKDEKYIGEHYYKEDKNQIRNVNIDPKSGAHVFYVPPSTLPSGDGWKVLGMYDPHTHTIYIVNNLSLHEEKFVYHHEVAHALGVYDESQADDYAAKIVGYNLRAA